MEALLIIDVQNGMFEEGVFNGGNLLQNINHLINKARAANTLIFYVQHNEAQGGSLENGTKGWEIHPDLSQQKEDVMIQKTTPDSFFNTSLDEELKSRGIEDLYITGIQTELCVDTTCRRAFSQGYKVTLVSDAHSTFDSAELTAQQIINHHNHTLRWFADVQPSDAILFKA